MEILGHAVHGLEVDAVKMDLVAETPEEDRGVVADAGDGIAETFLQLRAALRVVVGPLTIGAGVVALVGHPNTDDDLQAQALILVELRAGRRHVGADGVGAVRGGEFEMGAAAEAADPEVAEDLVARRAGGVDRGDESGVIQGGVRGGEQEAEDQTGGGCLEPAVKELGEFHGGREGGGRETTGRRRPLTAENSAATSETGASRCDPNWRAG